MSVFFRCSCMAQTHGVWRKCRDSVLMLLTSGACAVFFASHILHTLLTYRYGHKPTNPGFLANTTTPPQAVWAYSSGCSLRGPLMCAMSIHWLPPCWLASLKRPTSSVLASNNRQRSQTTSLCITASNGSSFLAAHRGNGYALRACHQMMMMMMTHDRWAHKARA